MNPTVREVVVRREGVSKNDQKALIYYLDALVKNNGRERAAG
jgi:hypothetical protein